MYRVIYVWHGERYECARRPETVSEANELVAKLRADGWGAWAESIGGSEPMPADDGRMWSDDHDDQGGKV